MSCRRRNRSSSSWRNWRTWSEQRSSTNWRNCRSWQEMRSWLSMTSTWRETLTLSNTTNSCRWVWNERYIPPVTVGLEQNLKTGAISSHSLWWNNCYLSVWSFHWAAHAFIYLICTFLHSHIQQFFGDEYYGENEEEKPQFDDDDDLAGSIVSLYTF